MRKLIPSLLLLCAIAAHSYAQNVGIGNTSPNSKLDVSGDLALREGTAITVAAGANSITLPTAKNSVYRLTGASGAFSITSISGGNDGMLLTLINATGQIMTVTNGTIQTNTGANLVGTTTVSTVNLIYNATIGKWVVVSDEGFIQASTTTNVYNSDGTLTGNRTLTMGANNLTLSATSGSLTFSSSTNNGNVALGVNNVATGTGGAAAIGSNDTASGASSFAAGINNKASGLYAIALGTNNKATASNSIAVGANQNITGAGGFAAGATNTASGTNSAVFGQQNTASGYSSFATGGLALASGQNAFSSGHNTTASGSNATAFGEYAVGSGANSVALGESVHAYSYGEVAVGQYNTSYSPASTTAYAATDRVFDVGNGQSGANSDALTVLKNGNVGIGNSSPSYKLQVNGTTSTTNLQMTTGAASGYVLQSDASGNGTWVNPSTISASNIYNSDGTLTGNRTVTMGGNNLYFNGSGNVGIGSTSPPAKLVALSSGSAASIPSSSSTAVFRIAVNSGEGIDFGKASVGPYAAWMQVGYNGGADPLVIQPLGGNVGIGNINPGATLDVTGNTRTVNFQMTSGANNGYILQSDASGNASWVSPSSISADNIYNSDGTLTGARTVTIGSNNLSFVSSGAYILLDPTASGRTGIGTSSPISLFANTPTNILGSDGHGVVNNSLTWAVNDGGYAAAIYNADNSASSNGLAVQIAGTASNTRILDLSTAASQGTTGTTVMAVLGTGNVGIGTGSPQQMLSVNTGMNIDQAGGNTGTVSSNALTFGNSSGEGIASNRNSGVNQFGLDFYTDYNNQMSITNAGQVAVRNNLSVGAVYASSTPPGNGVIIQGSVGIGTTSPYGVFDEEGTNSTFHLYDFSGSGIVLAGEFHGNSSNGPLLRFSGGTGGFMDIGTDGSGDFIINQGSTGATIVTASQSTGYVGIGTSSPGSTLTVNGTTSTTNFQMTNGGTSGYILQSDASGNGSWVNPSSVTTGTTNTLTNTTNTITSTVNGVAATAPAVNTNVLSISGDSITSTVNGVASNKLSLSGSNWSLTGNAGTTSSNFIGTTDNNPLYIKTNNAQVAYLPSTATGSIVIGLNNSTPTSVSNILIGANTCNSSLTGDNNIALGSSALKNNVGGYQNVAIGASTLINNTTNGNYNIAIGNSSMLHNNTGANNIALGASSLLADVGGNNNVAIGQSAGSAALGSGNIFLGNSAGSSETGSNKLYIANTNTATPLIYGDFTNKHLTINDSLTAKYLQIKNGATAGYLLQSDASGNASWVAPSSITTGTSNTLTNTTNTITSTVNGIAATAPAVNTNTLSLSGTTVTSSVNGVASNALDISSVDNNIYNADGTLTGNRTVTQGADNITFSSTTGNLIFNASSTGSVGVGTASPGMKFDVVSSENVTAATAIRGTESGATKQVFGVEGTVSSTGYASAGVYGYANAATAQTYGVFGEAASANGAGVYGQADASAPLAWGVYGYSSGGGVGVVGNANGIGGIGVWGFMNASGGIAVEGTSIVAGSNTNIAGYFQAQNGSANYAIIVPNGGGSVGIGTSSPSSTLQVNGKTTTTNLEMTNGANSGYILQSDASGNASWVNPTSVTTATSVSNTISGNTISTTVNGTAGTAVTVPNIYTANGTLTGARTVTMGANALTFSSTTGGLAFSTTSGTVNLGSGNIVNGSNATAIGVNNDASSAGYSTAIGYGNTANGQNSTAIGNGSTASGQGAVAFNTSFAGGISSFSAGYSTSAVGTYSIAMGSGVNARSYNEVALGSYNTTYTPTSATAWSATDRLFGIGNGTSASATSDAFVIMKNGNIGIGTSLPTYTLQVIGTTSTSNFQMTNGATAGYILKSDASGNASWVNPTTISAANIYNSNGTLTGARTVTMGGNTLNFSGGDVGIGTASTNATFNVNGNAVIGASLTSRSGSGLTVDYSNATTYAANTDPTDAARGLSIVNEGTTANEMAVLAMRTNPAGGANNAMLDMKLVNPNNGTSSLIYSFGPNASFTDRFTMTSAGYFGVGTTSPISQLANTATNIIGQDGNGVNNPSFTWAMSTNGYVGALYNGSAVSNANGLAIKGAGTASTNRLLDISTGSAQATAGTSVMVVEGNGNVGIGSTSPAQQLTVLCPSGVWSNAEAALSGISTLTGTTTSDYILYMGADKTNALSYIQSVHYGTAVANLGLNERGGNVGIGTGSSGTYYAPGNTLSVNGSGGFWNSNQLNFYTDNGSTNHGFVGEYAASSDFSIAAVTSGNWMRIGANNANIAFFPDNTLTTGSTPKVVISSAGYIGVGTTSPAVPVDIQTSVAFNEGSYGWLNSAGNTSTASCTSCNVSLRATQRIMGVEFDATSDRRIKKNIEPISAQSALDMALALPLIHYQYIDQFSKGSATKAGFIAQEVEKVIPDAVVTSTDYIPSIYAPSASVLLNGHTLTVTTTKPHDLIVGDEIKMYDKTNKAIMVKVTAVTSPTEFSIDQWNEGAQDALFVYGKKVPDLHSVDFDQITAVAIGAVQELNKKTQTLEQENTELKAMNEKLRQSMEQLKTSDSEQSNLIKTMKAQIDMINERLNITSNK